MFIMTTNGTSSKRPIGALSVDVKLIHDRLRKASIGDIVKDEELSAILGRDVQGKAAWIVRSAIKKAAYENHIAFGRLKRLGWKRLNDSEKVDTYYGALRTIRRKAQRETRWLTATLDDYDTLPAEVRLRHDTAISAMPIIAHIASEKQLAKISERVQKAHSALPLQKTLDAFSEKRVAAPE